MLKEEQFKLIGHALGINVYHVSREVHPEKITLPDNFYRNRYIADTNHPNWQIIVELVQSGYMGQAFNGTSFYVTTAGIETFKKMYKLRFQKPDATIEAIDEYANDRVDAISALMHSEAGFDFHDKSLYDMATKVAEISQETLINRLSSIMNVEPSSLIEEMISFETGVTDSIIKLRSNNRRK